MKKYQFHISCKSRPSNVHTVCLTLLLPKIFDVSQGLQLHDTLFYICEHNKVKK